MGLCACEQAPMYVGYREKRKMVQRSEPNRAPTWEPALAQTKSAQDSE